MGLLGGAGNEARVRLSGVGEGVGVSGEGERVREGREAGGSGSRLSPVSLRQVWWEV